MRLAYRPDIDGLRGLAVLSVIGYHAFPTQFRGGFAGVDVFFVISGFLITSILFEKLDESRLSFLEFYKGRCRRIFPALIIVTAACLGYGWFGLFPDDYKQLGRHAVGAATFVSNFLLWNEAGYFDNAAETKPLLHLWSLGIEEQFYLVWPLLLWLCWKSRTRLIVVCMLIVVGSFAFNVLTVNENSVAAFYSPVSRCWELIAGAFLSCLTFRHHPTIAASIPAERQMFPHLREGASLSGLVMIVFAVWATSRSRAFPGWWALLPVCGTCLVAVSGPFAWLNREVLSNRLLVWIGLISYPLYLWHWPFLTFARLRQAEPLTITARLGWISASFVLASVTYYWVEKPIRAAVRSRAVVMTLCGGMIAIGLLGSYIQFRDGLPLRLGEKEQFISFFSNAPPTYKYATEHHVFEAYRDECDFYDNRAQKPRASIAKECYTPTSDKALLIWGDSHAQHLYYGLRRTLPENISILQVATSDCRPSLADVFPNHLSSCNESNRFALDVAARVKPQVVLLAQGAGHDSTDFEAIAHHLRGLGVKRVLVAGPVPMWSHELYRVIVNDLWTSTPRRSFWAVQKDLFQIDRMLKAKYANSRDLTYISVIDCFCDDSGCLLYLGSSRRDGIVTHDSAHLSPGASEFLSEHLLKKVIIHSFETGN